MFEDDLTRGEAASPAPAAAEGGARVSRVRFVAAGAGVGPVGDAGEAFLGSAGEAPGGGARRGRGDPGGAGLIHDYDLALLAGYRNDWVDATRRRAEAEADQARALAKIVALSQHVREQATPEGANLTGAAKQDAVLRSFVAECATKMQMSDRALLDQCSEAWTLASRFAGTLDALSAGAITSAHARAITREGVALAGDAHSDETRARYEKRALELARQLTPGRLRTKLRSLAESMHPVPLTERHERAVECRRVWVRELEDGMAEVGAEVSAVLAYGIFDRLTKGARATRRATAAAGRGGEADAGEQLCAAGSDGVSAGDTRSGDAAGGAAGGAVGGAAGGAAGCAAGAEHADDARGIDQIRADIFADLLLTGTTGQSSAGILGISPSVTLLLPTGEHAEAATLLGYGPIDDVTARQLSATSPGWNRVGLDEDGGVTTTDRYRLTEAMRRTLEARDQHCRFPGCRMPTRFCDVDHTVEWMNGGETRLDNQAFLCRRHHALKHPDLLGTARWTVRQEAGGALVWTSPTGVEHTDHPEYRYAERPRTPASNGSAPSSGAAPSAGATPPDTGPPPWDSRPTPLESGPPPWESGPPPWESSGPPPRESSSPSGGTGVSGADPQEVPRQGTALPTGEFVKRRAA